MKTIFYETKKRPKEVDVSIEEMRKLAGGKIDIEEMICNTCVVWFKDAPVPKDRSSYHRNVYFTKQVDGRIETVQTAIYSNFFLCGLEDGRLTDFPLKNKRKIMSMFGF